MLVRVSISLRDDFVFPATEPENDNELQAKNREALSRVAHIDRAPYMFKQETAQGKQWTLYVLTYDEELPRDVEQAIERFASENPGRTKVLGAWDWDGKMFGTDWVFDADGNVTGTTGVPLYPLYGNFLRYMPDTIEWDEDGNVISTIPATVLTDVNRLQGQAPRRFS